MASRLADLVSNRPTENDLTAKGDVVDKIGPGSQGLAENRASPGSLSPDIVIKLF